jgi:glycosyltransferase involved in cell wall biosynthesis
MRILQIVHGNEAGGVKTLSEIIGQGLAARGVVVETAWLFPAPKAGGFSKLAGTWRVARRIASGRYDAVFAYQASASILTGLIGRLARCPRRIVHQTALPSEVKAPLRWVDYALGTLGFYTANVANSLETAVAFARYPARYQRAMTTIEHGVPVAQPTLPRTAMLERFGIPDDRRILLNIGRLTAQKNQNVLIRALAHVPSARLLIAGGGSLRSEYEALAARLNVADRLHLLGDVTRDDIVNLLAACDLFVFPSTWETFGLAAVEAAMAGVPIVAADLPVLRGVLAVGCRGAVAFVPPFDTDAWVQAMASSAQTDPTKRRALSQAVAQRYSVARMADAYLALLGQGNLLDAKDMRP